MALRRNYRQTTTGRQVKGVTTHLSVLNKPALIWWGYKQGMENFDQLMAELAKIAKKNGSDELEKLIQDFPVLGLYEKRDRAADAGTLAHAFIENHLRGEPEPSIDGYPPGVVEKAKGCFATFLEWKKSYKIKVIGSEIPLTSEQYPYGGTIDHIITTANSKGDVEILDIKTGKDIYLEAKLQVAAYRELWEEHHRGQPICGFHILRLGPDGEFTHKYWPDLGPYFEIYLHCVQITEALHKLGEKL